MITSVLLNSKIKKRATLTSFDRILIAFTGERISRRPCYFHWEYLTIFNSVALPRMVLKTASSELFKQHELSLGF
jgi:hypothetical protein